MTYNYIIRAIHDLKLKRFFDLFLIFLSLPLVLPLIVLKFLLSLNKFSNFIHSTQNVIKVFNIYKFRTMTDDCDERWNSFDDNDEARLTKFGKF